MSTAPATAGAADQAIFDIALMHARRRQDLRALAANPRCQQLSCRSAENLLRAAAREECAIVALADVALRRAARALQGAAA